HLGPSFRFALGHVFAPPGRSPGLSLTAVNEPPLPRVSHARQDRGRFERTRWPGRTSCIAHAGNGHDAGIGRCRCARRAAGTGHDGCMSGRPNVVFVFSDDHGYADRSILGLDPAVRTPALDRLAVEGVTCTNAYVTAPVCSPSRAGLIAGQYQARWGA